MESFELAPGRSEQSLLMRRRCLLFFGIIAPLLVFGSLAEDVVEKKKFAFDQEMLYFIHGGSSTVMDRLMAAITQAGSGIVLAISCAIAVLLLLRQRGRVAALYVVISFSGAALLNQLCKHIFARTRPDLWISALPETSFSFPSGHAINSMAMCGALIVVSWSSRWRGLVLACSAVFVPLVGVSRLYWGVHYPSDILAGWACAIAWICSVKYVFDMRAMSPICSPD
jgi:membrane-associated phospholipid phosphatase